MNFGKNKIEIKMTEDYPFPEDETKNSKINLDCRCPEMTCKRHGNCKECQAFHHKRCELSYCGK